MKKIGAGKQPYAIVGADGLPLALLDHFVDVDRLPSKAPGQRSCDGRLAGRHEADEIDLVGGHPTSRPSVSKKPG